MASTLQKTNTTQKYMNFSACKPLLNLNMKAVFNLGTLFIILSSFSLGEGNCGTALRGSVMCIIGTESPRSFRPTLCTHAAIEVSLKCENEVCNLISTPVLESAIDSLHETIPVGLHLYVVLADEDYLNRRSRRRNTANTIIEFMEARNLSFIQIYEESWRQEFKNTEIRNSLLLIELLADPLHARGWHIGMTLETTQGGLFAKYDLLDLATFVDWFSLPAHKDDRIVDGKFFLGSSYPLAYKNNASGSTKFYIDFMLQWIKPECLLIIIDLRGKKYTALESHIDPGPGSEGHPVISFRTYKEICQWNIDNSCYEGWDEEASTPYSSCGNEYFSYENASSIALKVELMKSYKLAGVELQSLHMDDGDGICGKGTYPNLRACQGMKIN